MATSKEANIFLPASLGGLGFSRLNDIIPERKRVIVDRLHESPMELSVAVTAMSNRARRIFSSEARASTWTYGYQASLSMSPWGEPTCPTCFVEAAVKLHPGQ